MFFFNKTKNEATLATISRLKECESKLEAIDRMQAVIEFDVSGEIITANRNFLIALGYSLDEIVGNNHRMFVDPSEHDSPEYKSFWASLARGGSHQGEFRRIRKDGSEIWIQAMYYALKDDNGTPFKVIKYATDITEKVSLQNRTASAGFAVSSSIEQMVATITEISGHVHQTVGLASETENEMEINSSSVQQLDESSQVIEKVVELIRKLAEQTNLLALNATIESARAGEAGKGFAVVANEVKELAKQTAEATESIDQSVTEIRSQILECVESTSRVSDSIRSVNESMASVAAAVEEQNATMSCLSDTAAVLR